MKKKKPTFQLWEVLLISIVSSLIMSLTTGYAVFTNRKVTDCSELVDNQHLGSFVNTYNSILSNYYSEVNEEELIDAAVNGMMVYLDDPYTSYLNEYSKDFLLDSLKGTYEGIGVEIKQHENSIIEIMSVFENSPAAKAGILVGDLLKNVNDTDLTDKTATDAVNLIKSSKDKVIKLTVQRAEELLNFELERKILNVPVVGTEIYESNNKKVGYISISKFSESVGEQFIEKLNEIEAQGIDNLIIDVRNNTGGYLKGTNIITSLFLEEGKVIYSLKSKLNTEHYKDETKEKREYPITILMNSASASASEVLAAALKYSYGATLLGETSYGKGKVQQTSDLTDGSMIKYTTAEWLTPNGDGIDGIGLKPDIEVVLSEEFIENPSTQTDNQLQTAIFEMTK